MPGSSSLCSNVLLTLFVLLEVYHFKNFQQPVVWIASSLSSPRIGVMVTFIFCHVFSVYYRSWKIDIMKTMMLVACSDTRQPPSRGGGYNTRRSLVYFITTPTFRKRLVIMWTRVTTTTTTRTLVLHYYYLKQGVAIRRRNTTGPPRAVSWWELRCTCECYRQQTKTTDDDKRQQPLLVITNDTLAACFVTTKGCVLYCDWLPLTWQQPIMTNLTVHKKSSQE